MESCTKSTTADRWQQRSRPVPSAEPAHGMDPLCAQQHSVLHSTAETVVYRTDYRELGFLVMITYYEVTVSYTVWIGYSTRIAESAPQAHGTATGARKPKRHQRVYVRHRNVAGHVLSSQVRRRPPPMVDPQQGPTRVRFHSRLAPL